MTSNANHLTAGERQVLTHSLKGGSTKQEVYRNYYAAGENHHNIAHIQLLVKRGYMVAGRKDTDHTYYHVTEEGAKAIGLSLPKD